MNRNVCLELWGGAGGRRHFPALPRGTCGTIPFPGPPSTVPRLPQRSARPREAARFVRSRIAGGSRNSQSPGGEDTVTRAEDRLWHQTHASPIRCLHTGDRACLRADIPASARNSHSPGPLPARRQIRLPGWTERVLGGVFKAAVPPSLLPPYSVPPRLLRPPHEPRGWACAARRAEQVRASPSHAAARPEVVAAAGALCPPSGPHSDSRARGHVGGDGQQRGGRWGRRRRGRAGFLPEPPGRRRRQPGLQQQLLPGGLGARGHGGGGWAGSAATAAAAAAASPPAGKSDSEIRSQGASQAAGAGGVDRGAAGTAVRLRGTYLGIAPAGSGPPSPAVPTREFSRARTALTPGDTALGAKRGVLAFQGAFRRWGAAIWVQLPRVQRAAGPLDGCGVGSC